MGSLAFIPYLVSMGQNEMVWVRLIDMLPPFYSCLVSTRPRRNLSLYVYLALVRRNEVVWGESCLHYNSLFSPTVNRVKWEAELPLLPCSNKVMLITLNSTHHLYPHSKVTKWCMLGGCPYFCQKGINYQQGKGDC